MLAYRHRLIFVTFALAWLLYIDRIAISTAKGPLTAAFGLPDTQFGWALAAFALTCKLEGIIPALESSHAIARVGELAKEVGKGGIVVLNLSGRGDKESSTCSKHRGEAGASLLS